MTEIIERIQLVPNIHTCTVKAPEIARKALPGQFVIVIPDEYSERIPITIADWDKKAGTVTFVFVEIGSSTQRLAELNTGDKVYSFTGPLGKPFELNKFGTVALIGGCYGIGGIYSAAKALKKKGNKVISYSEARSKFLLYWNDKLEEASDEVRYATTDGSEGMKGHAWDSLRHNLEEGEKIDYIIAVGCTFMMYKIAEVTGIFNVPTIVSMNPVMIDGTGMCGACRIVVDDQTKFACVDGPHFDAHKIDWDIVMSRRKAYFEEEIISKER
ncbi:MAG: sulfide/dihydroorotate dehydrogenase-like FAD/NAD-binding protein [Bacteroidales bacterium]|nr:MAG: sulfide/dihydroorotate dehydrogenase-like FAD/NAD-binding protein [Bacteroidales bacterium]